MYIYSLKLLRIYRELSLPTYNDMFFNSTNNIKLKK
jgi:hypothetical protein